MNEFLGSLKADLLDRRLLPLLALVGAALLAALAYIALGGGSSSSTSRHPLPVVAPPSGISVSQAAPSADVAVAETASGAALQRHGSAHDPFTLLPGAIVAGTTSGAVTSRSSNTGASSTSNSTSTSGAGSAGGSSPAKGESVAPAPAKPTQPSKPQVVIHYSVGAEFGVVPVPPEGSPPLPVQLTPYKSLKLHEALPAKNPQLVFLGVVLKTGKDAVFALTGESILHGEAKCVPSTTHCQAIELAPGQAETLETFEPNGSPVVYEVKLVSITKTVTTGSAARAHAASTLSRHALELLRHAGFQALNGLRYSSLPEVLVPVSAKAHTARRAHHG